MLDIPQVHLADAAQAAGVEFNTLRSWIARGALELTPHDQPAQGRGSRHLLTLRTLYTVAMMSELVSYGYAPGQAGLAAHQFSRVPFTYGDPIKVRNGGELFPEGQTVFVVFKPGESTPHADPQHIVGHSISCRFVNVLEPADYAKIFDASFTDERSAIVINCNSVCQRVDAALAEIRGQRRGGEER